MRLTPQPREAIIYHRLLVYLRSSLQRPAAEPLMTDLFRVLRQPLRRASGFAVLILFLALFPASAGQCARGTHACPMMAAGRCACCCAHPTTGSGLAKIPCPGTQAVPAPPALPAPKQSAADRGALPRHPISPSSSLALPANILVARANAPSGDSPPPAPPRSQAPPRAPPASLIR
jgi:hypothetical protein